MPAPKDPEKRELWLGRLSKSLKNPSEITRKRISQARKGKIPWNKGKSGLQTPWNKGKTGIYSMETLDRMRASHRNHRPSRITKLKMSISQRNLSEESRLRKSELWKGENNPNWCKFGEKHPCWKGGILPLDELIRKSVTYKLWRNAVFHRDKFRCQDCMRLSSGNLCAHHIYPFRQLLQDYNISSVGQAIRTEELWDINNGVTFCIKCHRKWHKRRNQTLEENEDLSGHRHPAGRDKAISGLERVKEISK